MPRAVRFFAGAILLTALLMPMLRSRSAAAEGGSVLGYGTAAGARIREYDSYARDYTGYLFDYGTYEEGVSVIDEGTLDTIAQQLRYCHRRSTAVARGPQSCHGAHGTVWWIDVVKQGFFFQR